MVCDRCVMVVETVLSALGLTVKHVGLGKAEVERNGNRPTDMEIEKAKEVVEYNVLSFSEIAYRLGYKNLQHLSRQFKEQTGMSMSEYQKLQLPGRVSFDKG